MSYQPLLKEKAKHALRDYQQEAIDAVWEGFKDGNVLVEAPTGSGKSHMIAGLIDKSVSLFPDTRILMLVHRKELVEQNAQKLASHGYDAQIYCASLCKKGVGQLTFASIQSLARCKHLPDFDYIIIDECHRIPTRSFGQYWDVINRIGAPCVGFTATPYRLQGGLIYGKKKLFPKLNYRISVRLLLKRGYLCPIVGYKGEGEADLSNVSKGYDGDYAKAQLQDAYTDPEIVTVAVDNLLTACGGKHGTRNSIIIFAAGVRHAEMIRAELSKREHDSTIITGDSEQNHRAGSISAFKRGNMRILINVGVFTEGFDAPNVDCVALMRATLSPGLYIQMVGRGMRPHEGKENCLLLDYGGNVMRHGPVDDVQPPSNQREKAPALTRVCPMCEMLVAIRKRTCPGCGFEFPPSDIDVKAKHAARAAHIDPLNPLYLETWKVNEIAYREHKKEGKKPCVMVTYRGGGTLLSSKRANEFLCPEHGGSATARTRQWCIRRGIDPKRAQTVEDLLKLLRAGYGAEPREVLVNTAGKWPEVVDVVF